MQASEVWAKASAELGRQMTKATYDAHVRGVKPLDAVAEWVAGSQVTLVAGSEASRQWLDLRFMPMLGRAIGDVVGGIVSVRVCAPAVVAVPIDGQPPSNGQPPRVAPTELAAIEVECRKSVEVVDRRRGFSMVEHVVVDEYLPVMGPTVFAVYALYCRLSSNREGRAWPGFRTVCAHLHIGPATLAEANQVLRILGLLDITKGDPHNPNRYYLLDAEQLDEGRRAAIRAAAVELSEGGTRRRVLDGLDDTGPSWSSSASSQKRSASSQKRCASPPEAEQQQTCLLYESETVVVVEDSDNNVSDVDELLAELVALGVERRTALNVLSTSALYRVVGWLDYTKAQENLKNPAGFFLSRLGSGDEPP